MSVSGYRIFPETVKLPDLNFDGDVIQVTEFDKKWNDWFFSSQKPIRIRFVDREDINSGLITFNYQSVATKSEFKYLTQFFGYINPLIGAFITCSEDGDHFSMSIYKV